jgi:hypothetical protein
MTIVDHQDFAKRLSHAMNTGDAARVETLLAEDYVDETPQSGERIRGRANFLAILANVPDGVTHEEASVASRADASVKLVAPSFTFVAVEGAGNTGTATFRNSYPDGSVWWVVMSYTLRDGKLARSTTFYAPVFPAPEWRSRWVERMRWPCSTTGLSRCGSPTR